MKDTNMASKPDISANRFKRLCYSLNELKKLSTKDWCRFSRMQKLIWNWKFEIEIEKVPDSGKGCEDNIVLIMVRQIFSV